MVDKPAFKMGDHVEKISGSSWRGRVVGTYSTDLTREGYAVESDTEKGSVQIYPAKALRLAIPVNAEQVERARETFRDALMDSQYMAGVTAGWNAAQDDDPETALAALRASRDGHLSGFAEAKSIIAAATPTEDARERAQEVAHRIVADFRPGGWAEKENEIARLLLRTFGEDARSRVKVLEEALDKIAFLSTNHGGWFESDPHGSYCELGGIARTALGNKETDRHG